MGTTFSPRRCDDDAARAWLREGRATLLRGWKIWLPAQVLSLVVLGALIHATQQAFLVAAFAVPCWGVHLAIADSLAQGHTGFRSWWRAVQEDWRTHGGQYAKCTVGYAAGLALFLLIAKGVAMWVGDTPSPASPVAVPLWIWLLVGMHVWFVVWTMFHTVLVPRVMGFHGQLYWKSEVPFLQAFALENQAFDLNRPQLKRLRWVFAGHIVVGLFLPGSIVFIEPFWAAVNRAAFADIFDQEPGLKALALQEARDALLPTAVPA